MKKPNNNKLGITNGVGFNNFAKLISKRQHEKNSDTFVVIYGPRRVGKTTLGFHILMKFLELKKQEYKDGISAWKVPTHWKELFKNYFSGDSDEMRKKLLNNPEESFNFVDEGNDVASWTRQLEEEQKGLQEVVLKAGKRKNLIIFIVPSMKLFTKTMLAQAHYLFMIPHEPNKGQNRAYLFKNYDNPILRENNPFGFKMIEKEVLKNKFLSKSENFIKYLKKQDRYITHFNYGIVPKRIYELYDVIVKEPLLNKTRKKRSMVPASKYTKVQYMFNTLINNLHLKEDKNINSIHKLCIDPFGFSLVSQPTLQKMVDEYTTMDLTPELKRKDIFEDDFEIKKPKEVEDLAFESLNC